MSEMSKYSPEVFDPLFARCRQLEVSVENDETKLKEDKPRRDG